MAGQIGEVVSMAAWTVSDVAKAVVSEQWRMRGPDRARGWLQGESSPFGGGPFGRLLSQNLEVQLLVQARQVSVSRDGEQLVAEVHHDAAASSRMICQGGLELGCQKAWVARGFEFRGDGRGTPAVRRGKRSRG